MIALTTNTFMALILPLTALIAFCVLNSFHLFCIYGDLNNGHGLLPLLHWRDGVYDLSP